MNALEWIKEYEAFLTVVKNRSRYTVKSYVIDVKLLYRFITKGKLGEPRIKSPLPVTDFDWANFTEAMAANYVRELRRTSKDTSVQRKIYTLRQFFKFLRKKKVMTDNPFAGDRVSRRQAKTQPELK